MADLYKQLKAYEQREAQKFPTSGTIARIDGSFVDVSVGTTIYRNVRVVGAASSTGQVVVLTWENGVPTAHTTDGSTPSSVALIRGPQGLQGPKGDTGAQGPQGSAGSVNAASTLNFTELSSAPSAPVAGILSAYAKTDNKIYIKHSDGTEIVLAPGVQILSAHGLNGTIAAGSTMSAPFFHYGLNASRFNFTISRPGTLKLFSGWINSLQPNTGILVATLMKNNAASTLTISWSNADGVAYKQDRTHSVPVVAGDVISIDIKNNAGSVSAQINNLTVDLEFS